MKSRYLIAGLTLLALNQTALALSSYSFEQTWNFPSAAQETLWLQQEQTRESVRGGQYQYHTSASNGVAGITGLPAAGGMIDNYSTTYISTTGNNNTIENSGSQKHTGDQTNAPGNTVNGGTLNFSH